MNDKPVSKLDTIVKDLPFDNVDTAVAELELQLETTQAKRKPGRFPVVTNTGCDSYQV